MGALLLERNFAKGYLKIDGILILGGATSPGLTKEFNQIQLGESVERLTESIQLHTKYPTAKFFFTGV